MADTLSTAVPVSSSQWASDAIAAIFGRTLTSPLPATDADKARMRDALNKNFVLDRNLTTGAVTVTPTRAAPASSDAADPDGLIAEVAQGYLPAARTSIESIDPTMCVPGACADDIACAVRQISALISMLERDAPRRDCVFQSFLYIHELIGQGGDDGDRGGGLIGSLEGLLGGVFKDDGHRTSALEKATQRLRAARQMVMGFETSYTTLTTPSPGQAMSAATEVVRRCAPHLADYVRQLRLAFEQAGIGSCELATLEVRIDCSMLGSQPFESLSLGEIMTTMGTEPQRWLELSAADRCDNVEAIITSASLLRVIAARMNGNKIARHFRLCKDSAERLACVIDRFLAYLGVVLDGILGPPPKPRRKRTGALQAAR